MIVTAWDEEAQMDERSGRVIGHTVGLTGRPPDAESRTLWMPALLLGDTDTRHVLRACAIVREQLVTSACRRVPPHRIEYSARYVASQDGGRCEDSWCATATVEHERTNRAPP